MTKAKKKSTRKLTLEAGSNLAHFFKILKEVDRNELFRDIESKFSILIKLNNVNMLVVKLPASESDKVYNGFLALNRAKKEIFIEDIYNVAKGTYGDSVENMDDSWNEILLRHNKPGIHTIIKPMNEHQKEAINSMLNKEITVLKGSAGTGKSILALAVGLKMLELKMVTKIIICKPPVESGPSIGFTPGSSSEKLGEYLISAMGTLTELIGTERRDKLLKDNTIQIKNIGYMRGVNFGSRDPIFIFADEVQNMQFKEHKMVLTRIGSHPNTRLVMAGDQLQSDLRYQKDDFSIVSNVIHKSKRVGSVEFTREDCVRSEACKEMLFLIEDYEDSVSKKGK